MFAQLRLLPLPILLWSLAACYQPLPAEGLSCSANGSCPEGQRCGLDGRCWTMPDAPCTPGSCGDGYECAADGRCEPEEDQEEPAIDTRSHVGRVLSPDLAADVKILGTMVSSQVVLTCKTCLSGINTESLSFAPGAVAQATAVREVVKHETADVAALFLASPLSQPGVALATAPPESGSEYVAVVPAAEAASMSRYRVNVTVSEIQDGTFAIMSQRCPAAGGPTFGSSGTADLIHGIHQSMVCSGQSGPYLDTRLDNLGPWIQQQTAAAEPMTCADADPTCPGVCADFTCDDSSGTVQTSCVANDGKCSGDQFCDPDDFSCKSCEPNAVRDCGQCGEQTCGADSTWGACMGKPITLNCGACGRNYCQTNGFFGGCTAVSGLCSGNATCQAQGAQFNCVTSSCSTAGWEDCQLDPNPSPPTVAVGAGFETGEGCPGSQCKYCTCASGGTFSCGSCYSE